MEKDGWVYLANQNKGMRVLDLDPKELGIEPDSQYSNVRIPKTDYYPALGTKGITIYGVISGLPLGNDWGLYLAEQPIANLQIGGAVDSQGNPTPPTPYISRFTANDAENKGYAPLYIHWNGASDSLPENFVIKLQGRKIGATSLNDATSTKIYEFTFRRRHNGNVTFKEVLAGSAVYSFDTVASPFNGTTTETQGLKYVQELLNQVVPRMREIYDDNQQLVTYNLVEEDGGIYDAATYNAVMLFKNNFVADPNESDTYKKIKKDYGLNTTDANNNAIDANNRRWFYKIIDKETLVGKDERIPNWFTGMFTGLLDNSDYRINESDGNTRNDTGLYELYRNVVELFVNAMIDEGDRYRKSTGSGYLGANISWISRTNDTETESESYCYGCKNKYDDFWQIVTKCAPPTNEEVVDSDYRGDVNDAECSLGGAKRFPGLFKTELDTGKNEYQTKYWAGIDCSGFVQRIANYAEFEQGGITSSWRINTEIGDIRTSALQSGSFFDNSRVSYWESPEYADEASVKLQKKLRKGDLVRYKDEVDDKDIHITTIYSDRPSCSQTSCTYDIIHAYGWNKYARTNQKTGKKGKGEFSRKVTITGNDITAKPAGFGRIRLWD